MSIFRVVFGFRWARVFVCRSGGGGSVVMCGKGGIGVHMMASSAGRTISWSTVGCGMARVIAGGAVAVTGRRALSVSIEMNRVGIAIAVGRRARWEVIVIVLKVVGGGDGLGRVISRGERVSMAVVEFKAVANAVGVVLGGTGGRESCAVGVGE